MKFLVGCDPEVFVQKNGIFHSAHNLIPGDKKNPFKVEKGAVQVDGMALEFNIEPAKSEDEFVVNVSTVFDILKAMVPEYNVIATPVADFTDEVMKAQPAEALELGCDPDFNAWTHQENVKPNANRPMRTASGHVHIGWTHVEDKNAVEHLAQCMAAIKQMDYYLALPSLFIDGDTRRRSMYGKGGCYRPKVYGVEYRTLSNFWLNSKELMGWVYRNVQLGMQRLIDGEDLPARFGDIQDIINNSNKKEAAIILNQIDIPLPKGYTC